MDSGNPKIIVLSELLNKLPLFKFKPDIQKFRNPNGVTLKLSNFKALDPNYKGKGMEAYSLLDKEVFEEFFNDRDRLHKIASHIKQLSKDKEISNEISQIEDDELSESDIVKEGQVLYKYHKVRERNRKIVEAKKRSVLKKKGELVCEACGFNFEITYGELGKGYIECHHIVPLWSFEDTIETKIEDLVLLCSNCHSMIHRDRDSSTFSSFKSIINTK